MIARCSTCGHELAHGVCDLCAGRRLREKIERQRDDLYTRVERLDGSNRRQRAYIKRLHKQLGDAGLEPVASEEVEGLFR